MIRLLFHYMRQVMENSFGLAKGEKFFAIKMVSYHVTPSTISLMEIEYIIKVSTTFRNFTHPCLQIKM